MGIMNSIKRKWLDNNILDSFNIICDNFKFEFSIHPQDPEVDMSHYVVEKPAIILMMKIRDVSGVLYSVILFLSAKLSLRLVRQKAKEMIDGAGMRWIKNQKTENHK